MEFSDRCLRPNDRFHAAARCFSRPRDREGFDRLVLIPMNETLPEKNVSRQKIIFACVQRASHLLRRVWAPVFFPFFLLELLSGLKL